MSRRAGIANPAGKGLGVVFCDVDGDGLADIYVANDLVRNFLYRNNGDGTFRDIAYAAGVGFDLNGKPQAGMGTDCADVAGNGLPDIFVTNFSDELNTLYENQGDDRFEDVSSRIGLGSGFLPARLRHEAVRRRQRRGPGHLRCQRARHRQRAAYHATFTHAQKDLLYENAGGRFRGISSEAGPGLQIARVGRGLAVADFDNDGNLDLVITNVGEAPVLLRNEGTRQGNWLSIRARGSVSNRFGLGARVVIETAAGRQVREINNAASYQSANDVRLHVGLGAAKAVERLEIR